MEKVLIHGKMVESMKVNINMIKNMVMVFISGLMEENMKDFGNMENNMEKENIINRMEI